MLGPLEFLSVNTSCCGEDLSVLEAVSGVNRSVTYIAAFPSFFQSKAKKKKALEL